MEPNKKLLLEQLRKTPIVETACQKVGVGRSTYYFWRQEDSEFARLADEAIHAGKQLVSDVAESQLITLIKNGNLQSIIFWLKNNHDDYKTKLEISGQITHAREALSDEETEMLQEALKLMGFSVEELSIELEKNKNENQH